MIFFANFSLSGASYNAPGYPVRHVNHESTRVGRAPTICYTLDVSRHCPGLIKRARRVTRIFNAVVSAVAAANVDLSPLYLHLAAKITIGGSLSLVKTCEKIRFAFRLHRVRSFLYVTGRGGDKICLTNVYIYIYLQMNFLKTILVEYCRVYIHTDKSHSY